MVKYTYSSSTNDSTDKEKKNRYGWVWIFAFITILLLLYYKIRNDRDSQYIDLQIKRKEINQIKEDVANLTDKSRHLTDLITEKGKISLQKEDSVVMLYNEHLSLLKELDQEIKEEKIRQQTLNKFRSNYYLIENKVTQIIAEYDSIRPSFVQLENQNLDLRDSVAQLIKAKRKGDDSIVIPSPRSDAYCFTKLSIGVFAMDNCLGTSTNEILNAKINCFKLVIEAENVHGDHNEFAIFLQPNDKTKVNYIVYDSEHRIIRKRRNRYVITLKNLTNTFYVGLDRPLPNNSYPIQFLLTQNVDGCPLFLKNVPFDNRK